SASIKMRVAQVPVTVTKAQGDARSDTVNKAVTVLPRVTVADSSGSVIAGDTVTFAVATGGGSIPANGAIKVTDANGVATVGGWTLGSSATAQTMIAN